MGIINCILSYIKPKKEELSETDNLISEIINSRLVNNPIKNDPSYKDVRSILNDIYWKIFNIYWSSSTVDNIRFLGKQDSTGVCGKSSFTIDFLSGMGHTGIIIEREQYGCEFIYNMIYLGINGKEMFHTDKGFIVSPEETIDNCKLAIKEFQEYLDEVGCAPINELGRVLEFIQNRIDYWKEERGKRIGKSNKEHIQSKLNELQFIKKRIKGWHSQK